MIWSLTLCPVVSLFGFVHCQYTSIYLQFSAVVQSDILKSVRVYCIRLFFLYQYISVFSLCFSHCDCEILYVETGRVIIIEC